MCFRHEKAILSPSVGSDRATLTSQRTEAAFVWPLKLEKYRLLLSPHQDTLLALGS